MEVQAEPDGRTNILDAWALWRRIGIGELGEVAGQTRLTKRNDQAKT